MTRGLQGRIRGWFIGFALLLSSAPALALVSVKAGEGLVMARVIANRAVGDFFNKWEVLTVQDVTTKEKYRLVDQSPRASVQSDFLKSLPPGDYEIVAVAAGNVNLREWTGFDPKLFTFSVVAGRLTNLGTLIYLRPYSPINTRVLRWVFEEQDDLPGQLAFLLDDASNKALTGEPLGWAFKGTRGRLTADVKHLSMRLAGRVSSRNGAMLFGENFGQIARRDASGTWTWEDTGVLDCIQVAAQAADGSMYAMADNSVLLAREAGGTWHRLSVPLAGALPRFLGVDTPLGLITVWEQNEGVTVLAAKDARNPAWVTLRFIKPRAAIFGDRPVRSFVMKRGPKIVVGVTTPEFLSRQYDLHILDTVTNEWTQQELHVFGPVSAFGDDMLYSMSGHNIKQTFRVSTDWGKTWESRSSPNWSSQPTFRTPLEGYLIRTDHIPAFNPANLTDSLWRTLDGGKTWEKQVELPNAMAAVILLPGQQMLLVTRAGKLFFSPDNGKTMTLERDSTRPVF